MCQKLRPSIDTRLGLSQELGVTLEESRFGTRTNIFIRVTPPNCHLLRWARPLLGVGYLKLWKGLQGYNLLDVVPIDNIITKEIPTELIPCTWTKTCSDCSTISAVTLRRLWRNLVVSGWSRSCNGLKYQKHRARVSGVAVTSITPLLTSNFYPLWCNLTVSVPHPAV